MRNFLPSSVILTALTLAAPPPSAAVTVDAKANIFAAGRGTIFNGLVPPVVRFAAGPGKVVTFPTVSGLIACDGIAYEPLHGPDGTVNRCGGTGTFITSWAGISGIIHKTRQLFLVGVFLDEREPADPAPARLDFSTSENYANLSPLLAQVFFIGDGRSGGGALQQVTVPAAATRLYLGFADAVGFNGTPTSYQDNNGSLEVTVAGVTPFVPGPVATGTTMTVNGKSSIFWAGYHVNWSTEMPPGWRFTAAPGRTLTVVASGSVTCKTGISAPPEGTAACGSKTDLEPWGSISGIKHPSRSMFLVGLFLTDGEPRGWPDTSLNFTDDGFTTLEPLIGQTFYVGTGAGKRFVVPHNATRVFLGYARSDSMIGNPGWYDLGGGSLTATINLTAGTNTGSSPIMVDAKSNIYAAGREEAFDGFLPPMVRFLPGPGKVLRVPQVTGAVRCCGGGFTGADGAPYQTNVNAYRGLSGIEAKWRGYFLAGVFLDANVPDGSPPEKLVFTEPFTFATLAPKIGQVFLIGDGVTPSAVPHEFLIPDTATRLYLGFAMARLFVGDPGYYWEANDGFKATISIGVQPYSARFTHAGGAQRLLWTQLLLAAAPNGGGQSFCFVHFDRRGNSFWLYSDILAFFLGPVAPGVASNLLQGSLCALQTATSSVVLDSGGITVNAALVFKASGARNIYTRSLDDAMVDTNWQQKGSLTLQAVPAPGGFLVSPSTGSGSNQVFTAMYPEPAGFAGFAFGWVQLLVAAASNGGGQPFCYVHYDRAGNRLWMYSSDVGFFLGPVAPGASSSLLNSSACTVSTTGAAVDNPSGQMRVQIPLTLKTPMNGAKKIYQRTLDALQRDSGWQQTGNWSIP